MSDSADEKDGEARYAVLRARAVLADLTEEQREEAMAPYHHCGAVRPCYCDRDE